MSVCTLCGVKRSKEEIFVHIKTQHEKSRQDQTCICGRKFDDPMNILECAQAHMMSQDKYGVELTHLARENGGEIVYATATIE